MIPSTSWADRSIEPIIVAVIEAVPVEVFRKYHVLLLYWLLRMPPINFVVKTKTVSVFFAR
jgi:hypothetical protein